MDDARRSRPPIDRARLARLLEGSGTDVVVLEEAGSTNAVAADRVRTGRAGHGSVVVAEHQTAGRGRLDRAWETPARSALTLSVVLQPDVAPQRWPWLPLLVGYAAHRALARHGVVSALKWPNDVLVDDRKVAGILVERIEGPEGPVAVAGLGLNVSTTADELPVPTATSVQEATGRPVDRTDLLAALVREVVGALEDWRGSDDAALHAAYADACSTIGRDVRVEVPSGAPLRGRAAGVDDQGRLLVDGAGGRVALSAGDVVHVRAGAP